MDGWIDGWMDVENGKMHIDDNGEKDAMKGMWSWREKKVESDM